MSSKSGRRALPDANIWLAALLEAHTSHHVAHEWLIANEEEILFCRVTQLSLLRHLTQPAIMGPFVRTQKQAWVLYDALLDQTNILFAGEPAGLDAAFRQSSDRDEVSPKRWTDDYLAAFAVASGSSLVTFDRALAARVEGSVLLTA